MRRFLVALLLAGSAASQVKFPAADGWKSLFNGKNLDGWQALDPAKSNHWTVVRGVQIDAEDPKILSMQKLTIDDLMKGILFNGSPGKTVNLITRDKHGDVELYLEFLVPKNSNSGVYFQGLYEIQILDSYGKTELTYSDCGGVYGRYIDGKTVGGVAPRVNASKPPGQWQSFHVWFRAPRFDGSGKRTEKARFIKVVHNGVTIHENVELEGPTRASMTTPESPAGPLMLQGDHGPVAYRNVHLRPIR